MFVVACLWLRVCGCVFVVVFVVVFVGLCLWLCICGCVCGCVLVVVCLWLCVCGCVCVFVVGGGDGADIKSNNPHLTGGEQHLKRCNNELLISHPHDA